MDYEVIDTVQGDSLEPGDIVRVGNSLWEISTLLEDDNPAFSVWAATNLSENDGEDTVTVLVNANYDLMGY
jgi:hypothetical protein